MKHINQEYLRSALFGIEDSLVSTTGLIAGLSVGTSDNKLVLLGGTVAIIVEAVSMGASEYISSDAVQDLDKLKRHGDEPLKSGLLMLVSYAIAGLVPLLPVVFLGYPGALILSIVLALIGLFLLGYAKGRLLGISPWRGSFKILIVGGLATGIGVLAGLAFSV